MIKKYFVFGLLFFIFAVPSLLGVTVLCMVAESGLPPQGPRNQYSIAWENALMEVLFESGFIASNAPILRLGHKGGGGLLVELEAEIEAAREGGADYFLVAAIEFADAPPRPQTIALKLYGIKTGAVIFEQVHERGTYRTAREENEEIKKYASAAVGHIK
jgi:hypothetical protein